ncbi:hypothetical protein H4219_002880 [Mycoemilia scoparia]|uniref:Uncharacterized protein n=1 Tax=Mycoemilia scoparia TaxID=417184 RepID=A0A9W8A4D9_9FUNG|nr:hypothetical protein H4219_002880 [Mycoemilia scoparia]
MANLPLAIQQRICEVASTCSCHSNTNGPFFSFSHDAFSARCSPAVNAEPHSEATDPLKAPCLSTLRRLCTISTSWREAALSVLWSHLDLSSPHWSVPSSLESLHAKHPHRPRAITFRAGDWLRSQHRPDVNYDEYFVSAVSMGWTRVESCRLDLFDGRQYSKLLHAAITSLPRLKEIYIRDKGLRWHNLQNLITQYALCSNPNVYMPRHLERMVVIPYGFDQHPGQLAPHDNGGPDIIKGMGLSPITTSQKIIGYNSSTTSYPRGSLLEVGAGGSDVSAQFLLNLANYHPALESLTLDHFWAHSLQAVNSLHGHVMRDSPLVPMRNLQHLRLVYPILGAPNESLALDASVLPNLRSLSITDVRTANPEQQEITGQLHDFLNQDKQQWINLESLHIPSITDEEALLLPKACPNLRYLVTSDKNWTGHKLTDMGFLHLVTSLPKLKRLEINHRGPNGPGYKLTQSIVPGCSGCNFGSNHTTRHAANDAHANQWVCSDLTHLIIPRTELALDKANHLLKCLPNLQHLVLTLRCAKSNSSSHRASSRYPYSRSAPNSPSATFLYENDYDSFYNWANNERRTSLSSDLVEPHQLHFLPPTAVAGFLQSSNAAPITLAMRTNREKLTKELLCNDCSHSSSSSSKVWKHKSITKLGLDGDILTSSGDLIQWLQQFPSLSECKMSYERRSKYISKQVQKEFPSVQFKGFSI